MSDGASLGPASACSSAACPVNRQPWAQQEALFIGAWPWPAWACCLWAGRFSWAAWPPCSRWAVWGKAVQGLAVGVQGHGQQRRQSARRRRRCRHTTAAAAPLHCLLKLTGAHPAPSAATQACPNALGSGTVASLPSGVTPAGGAGLPASLEGLVTPQELQRLATQGSQAVRDELARLSGRRLTQDTSLGGLLANVAGQPGYLVRTWRVVGLGTRRHKCHAGVSFSRAHYLSHVVASGGLAC